jgi:CDP-diacylglycerol---glycerol-3-phosphate 3-phosphatidyltransferase
MMNLPNRITSIRLFLVFVNILILIYPYQNVSNIQFLGSTTNLVYFIAGLIFIVASITDFLDGFLARKLNLITNLGKFLDPVADKVLTNTSLIILMMTPSWISYSHVTIPLWAVLIMVTRDLIIDALRMIGVSQGKIIAANIFGKVKTFFQMITLIFVFFNGAFFSNLGLPIGWSVTEMMIYLTALTSLVSLVVYVYQNRHVFY